MENFVLTDSVELPNGAPGKTFCATLFAKYYSDAGVYSREPARFAM